MNTVTIAVRLINHLMQQQSQCSHLHHLTMELQLMSQAKLVIIINKQKRQHMSITCHLILHPTNQITEQFRPRNQYKIR
jgi:hypothetical protein